MSESLRTALTGKEVQLLTDALGRSSTAALDPPVAELSAADFNRLWDVVADLMMRDGIEADSSTLNELGLRCEDLIDRLAPWHWGKE